MLAKAELLKEVPELVNYFNLLVCVVNVILNHVPKALGAVDFTDTSKFPVRTESGAADTLASLALVSLTLYGNTCSARRAQIIPVNKSPKAVNSITTPLNKDFHCVPCLSGCPQSP